MDDDPSGVDCLHARSQQHMSMEMVEASLDDIYEDGFDYLTLQRGKECTLKELFDSLVFNCKLKQVENGEDYDDEFADLHSVDFGDPVDFEADFYLNHQVVELHNLQCIYYDLLHPIDSDSDESDHHHINRFINKIQDDQNCDNSEIIESDVDGTKMGGTNPETTSGKITIAKDIDSKNIYDKASNDKKIELKHFDVSPGEKLKEDIQTQNSLKSQGSDTTLTQDAVTHELKDEKFVEDEGSSRENLAEQSLSKDSVSKCELESEENDLLDKDISTEKDESHSVDETPIEEKDLTRDAEANDATNEPPNEEKALNEASNEKENATNDTLTSAAATNEVINVELAPNDANNDMPLTSTKATNENANNENATNENASNEKESEMDKQVDEPSVESIQKPKKQGQGGRSITYKGIKSTVYIITANKNVTFAECKVKYDLKSQVLLIKKTNNTFELHSTNIVSTIISKPGVIPILLKISIIGQSSVMVLSFEDKKTVDELQKLLNGKTNSIS